MSRFEQPDHKQPDHEPALQHFHRYIEDHLKPGILNATTESDPHCRFLPEPDLNAYFTTHSDKVIQILEELFPVRNEPWTKVQVSTVIKGYKKVFTILLRIGRGTFIVNFVGRDSLCDRRLPHVQRPDAFPHGSSDFWKEFYNQQWLFCAPEFTYQRTWDWEPQRILPIVSKERIGGEGSAVTYKIEIHPAYNKLCPHHDGSSPQDHPAPNTFVLKTFRSPNSKAEFQREVKAFLYLRYNSTRDCSIIDFYGSYNHNGTFNVILEWANEGTLEEYFKRSRPSNSRERYIFWQGFLPLARALGNIHRLKDRSRILEGWHQDVKPQNILVSTLSGELRFKLADLGLTHFQILGAPGMQGRDTEGTRTYGAPECYRPDDSSVPDVGSVNDIWSLGCVLSEAVVWVVDGSFGLQLYRQQRKEATSHLRYPGCFHNGIEDPLDCVKDIHQRLRTSVQASLIRDTLTPKVLDVIEYGMLVKQSLRKEAPKLWQELRIKLDQSVNMDSGGDSRILLNHHASLRQSSSAAPRLAEGSSSPSSPPRTGHFEYPSSSAQVAPTEPQPLEELLEETMGLFSPQNLPPSSGGPPPQSFDNEEVSLISPLESPMRQFQYLGSPPTIALTNPPPSSQAQPGGASYTPGPTQRHSDSYVLPASQSLRQPSYEHANSASYRSRTSDSYHFPNRILSETRYCPPSTTAPSYPPMPTSEGENIGDFQAAVAAVVPALDNSQYIGTPIDNPLFHPPPIPRGVALGRPIPKIPFWPIDEALNWRKMVKSRPRSFFGSFTSRSVQLPEQYHQYETPLVNRDHIILLDDSSSMSAHWKDVLDLLDLLGYILKNTDPDGLEVYFTINDFKGASMKKAKDLVHIAQVHRPRAVQPEHQVLSNPETRLNEVFLRYRRKLDQYETAIRHRRRSKSLEEVRMMNIYVFTDGLWQPGADLQNSIISLIKRLDELDKPRRQVGIEFIQFGNDPEATRLLTMLDNELNTTRDIVDRASFTDGNVLKMLLGCVEPWFDSQDGPPALYEAVELAGAQ